MIKADMIDYNKYVGIPWVCGKAGFDGADCWGLVSMIYQELFDISLQHFHKRKIDTQIKTIEMIEKVRESDGRWVHVLNAVPGDVVMMFGIGTGRPEHIGVYIGNNKILHSLHRETGISEVHNIKMMKLLFQKLEFYRYYG